MSKTFKPFVDVKFVRCTAPKPVDLTDCKATFDRARNEVIRPILAGIKISCTNKVGTLGLAYINQTGGKRMITAGHVCTTSGDAIGQPDNEHVIANVMGFAPPYNGAQVDVAKANVELPENEVNDNGVFGYLIDYWIDYFYDWTTEGDEVQIEGAASGTSSGKVHIPYANISVGDGDRVDVAAVATYASQGMDSGGPVIGFKGKDANFYGIHGGRVVIQGVSYSWFVPFGAFSDFL